MTWNYVLKVCSVAIVCTSLNFSSSLADSSSALGCFIRNYDKSHLANHSNQLVTNVRLAIRNPKGASPYRYEFMLDVRVRGREEGLTTEGMCKEEGALKLHCVVECDGGGVDLNVRDVGVMMHLDRIRMASCGKDINN